MHRKLVVAGLDEGARSRPMAGSVHSGKHQCEALRHANSMAQEAIVVHLLRTLLLLLDNLLAVAYEFSCKSASPPTIYRLGPDRAGIRARPMRARMSRDRRLE